MKYQFLAPVDAFPAQNRWGIHGVIGNVWEWTSTWYTARHSPLPKTNDTGPPKGTDRVKKGGFFYVRPSIVTGMTLNFYLENFTVNFGRKIEYHGKIS